MNVLFDLRYALRNLMRTPSFILLTIFVMSVGLGASIFIISVVKNYIYDPMYFPDGDRVVSIQRRVNHQWRSTLLHDYQAMRDQAKSFDLFSGHVLETAVLSDAYKSIYYSGTHVVGDFFEVTGVTAAKGRVLSQEDQQPGALPVVVLSHEVWQSHFGGDEKIVGKQVRINRAMHEVVGVAKPDIAYPLEKTVWLPLQLDARTILMKESPSMRVYARLKADVNLAQAAAEVYTIFNNTPALKLRSDQVFTPLVMPVKKLAMRGFAHIFHLLLIAGLCVLLLCCINVGNLLLGRANGRMAETAVRLALGAPRHRLLIQLLWEAGIICVAGGLLATILAGWGVEQTQVFLENRSVYAGYAQWAALHFGWAEISWGVVVTLAAILLVGVLPALRATGCNVNSVLKDGSKTALGKKAGRVQRVLVNIQITLSCILMVMAGVLFLKVQDAIEAGYGISLDNFLVGEVNPQREFYAKGKPVQAYFDRLLEEVSIIDGVEKATLISAVPTEYSAAYNMEAENSNADTHSFVRANRITAYPNAFDVLGIPLLEGRIFNSFDRKGTQKVVIISQSLADKLWPNESPIGKRLRRYNDKKREPNKWETVVGVVPHIVHRELFDSERTPNLYTPYAQNTKDKMTVVLKTRGDPALSSGALAAAAHRIDPNTPVYRNLPLANAALGLRRYPDLIRTVFALFAGCALVMSVTGIYGVVAQYVRRRTQEIGVRRALGIPDNAIRRMLFWQSTRQLLFGVVLGLPLALVCMAWLFKVQTGASYFLIYLTVPGILLVAIVFATWIPMAKAMGQSPADALRYE